MNRQDLQRIAELRVQDAKVLLDNDGYAGAYYLAGYAVECALKACIAKAVREHDFPDLKLVRDSYTHDLDKLLSVAGLKGEHELARQNSTAFAVNWEMVKDWSENARYVWDREEQQARSLYSAITDEHDGVLPWLKQWW